MSQVLLEIFSTVELFVLTKMLIAKSCCVRLVLWPKVPVSLGVHMQVDVSPIISDSLMSQ